MNEFGDDDSQVVKGNDGGLVDGGENDGSLLSDEQLDVRDDLVEDGDDRGNDGRDLVDGQVIGSEAL